MKPTLLANARVVFADQTCEGVSVYIEDGVISALDPLSAGSAQVIDLRGRTLIPGAVDLHCDALEKEVEPRPGVHFPLDFACLQTDKRNATSGITTVFHALSFANHELGVRNNHFAAEIIRTMNHLQPQTLVDNRIHARYEVTDESAIAVLLELLTQGQLHMLSFMDHSPGQGQFRDLMQYRSFLARTYHMDEQSMDDLIARKQEASCGTLERMRVLAERAHTALIPLASHDDDSCEKVDLMASLGVVISEFPVNMETARAVREGGLCSLFGAPNILRGKSQSGAMKALDAVVEGVAKCLCADYSPAALVPAVLQLPRLTHISLHDAVALATRNPAQAAGLHDRGEIAVGKRADLVSISQAQALPRVERVWVAGVPVLTATATKQEYACAPC